MSRTTGVIALGLAALAFIYVMAGHPLPADQWLGDAPVVVQASVFALLWLLVGWFAAPWIRYVGRQLRAAADAFNKAER